jgi:hypothetical protein
MLYTYRSSSGLERSMKPLLNVHDLACDFARLTFGCASGLDIGTPRCLNGESVVYRRNDNVEVVAKQYSDFGYRLTFMPLRLSTILEP